MTRNLLRLPVLGLAALAALVAVAGAASAEYYEGKPDCPPDMACTTSAPDEGGGSGATEDPSDCGDCPKSHAPADDGPTYDGNCGGEVCASDGDPNAPTSDQDPGASQGGGCMDGSTPDAACAADGRQYLDGREPAPQESGAGDDLGAAGAGGRSVPALGVLAMLVAALGVAGFAAFRRP